MNELVFKPYKDGIDTKLADKEISVTQLVEQHLRHIEDYEPVYSAFIHIMKEEALQQAQMLDTLPHDQRGPLHGMIVSIKDTIDIQGVATTCASHSRLGRVATRDADIVARLRAAGAIFIGKANCHEFAFGGPAFDLPFPPARNPWNRDLFPGGSSSGSGVSVAAGFCHVSIGTDTAGSIRLPSSHCGTAGLKLATNSVSLEGVNPLSPSLDSIGPLARSVADCAAVYEVIADIEPFTPSRPKPQMPQNQLVLAIPEPGWLDKLGCDDDVLEAYELACTRFRANGVTLQPIILPDIQKIHAASAVVMMREAADIYAPEVQANYASYGEIFRNRTLLGEHISDQHYQLALAQCQRYCVEISAAMQTCTALLLPAYPNGPAELLAVDKFYFLQSPNLNAIANGVGMPVLSLPVLRDNARRPLGIQLMARREDVCGLLVAGRRFEELLAYPHRNPFAKGPNGH